MTKNQFSSDQIQVQVLRIIQSPIFIKSKRLRSFLQFIVNQVLDNKQHLIKQTTIASYVFNLGKNFDSQTNPLIRIQASRLRKALAEYYLKLGANDEIIITIPKGGYVPEFQSRQDILQQELTLAHNSNSWLNVSLTEQDPELISKKTVKSKYTKLMVLPFINCSQNSDYDYIIDGLGDLITTELSHFSEIAVIAYFSSRKYKYKYYDLTLLEEELGVKYVLTGRIYYLQEEFLVFVNLISTETHEQVWSEKFQFSLSKNNFFEIQDKIVKKLLSLICSPFGCLQQACSTGKYLKNSNSGPVFEAILRSNAYWLNLNYENFVNCYKVLTKVIESNPNNSFLLAMLAQHLFDAEVFGYMQIKQGIEQGRNYVTTALTLNSNCQYAHYANAYASLINKEPQKIISSATRILEINPYNAFMVGGAGWWMSLAGDFNQGLSWLVESMELNPYYPSWFHFAFYLNYFQEQEYEKALIAAEKTFVPDFFWSYILKYATLSKLNKLDLAKSNYLKTCELNPDFRDNYPYYLSQFIILDDILLEIIKITEELV